MRRSPGEVPAKAGVALVAILLCLATATAASAQVSSFAMVPNSADGTVSMVDVATGTIGLTPLVGGMPNSVAVTPDGRWAYAAVGGVGLVMIDMSTGITTTVATAAGAMAVVLTPDGRKAYFTDIALNTVTPVDVATNTAGSAIAVGLVPQAIGIAPDGLRAYALNATSHNISVIDTASDTVVATIPLIGSTPNAIVFTPNSQTAYVAMSGSNTVSVVDLVTQAEVGPPIALPGGAGLNTLTITIDGSTIFTANNGGAGSVSVIDTGTKTVLTTVATPGASNPLGIAITPDTSTAYVLDADHGRVMRFDVATHTFALPDITVGNNPLAQGNFMSPRYIIPGGALGFADENQLIAGLRSTTHADFQAGTLNVGFNWTSHRIFSLLLGGGTIDTAGVSVATLTNTMVGEGTLIKQGFGTLVLGSTFTTQHAGTHISAGALQVDGHHTSPITLTGGTLSGTGTVGDVTGGFGGGDIKPGTATTPGTLTMHNLSLAASNVHVHVRVNSAGSYDVLNATGTAALDDAWLDLSVNYTPGPNDTFTIAKNTTGAFIGFAEGTTFFVNNTYLHITYKGGASGHDAVIAVDKPPTISSFPVLNVYSDAPIPPIPFTVSDDFTPASDLTFFTDSSDQTLVPLSNIHINGTGQARTLSVTLAPGAIGQTVVTVVVSDHTQQTFSSLSIVVTRAPQTYYLAEGATGSFFSTDLLIVNPTNGIVPATITFFKADGTTVDLPYLLSPTSRFTLPVKFVPGMESTAFSTRVVSPTGYPLAVERTMWWDENGYGSHGEKASAGPALQWYFAEGSQGYFHTYFLLLNPTPTANVAHVTYLPEDGPAITKDYALAPTSRTTIDIAAEAELINRSFGALVKFDIPGMAERAMYFGDAPLYSGGHDSSGATAPSTSWVLAEGATGSFFDTFILIANPGDTAANVTTTYLPASGIPVAKTHAIAAHQRLTINIATEDPTLASAAVGTSISSDQPVIAERSQYWPHGGWYEAHNSAGETSAGTKWALAEGRVGGDNHAQTYILLANSGAQAAEVTATFMRENGTTVVKTFTVAPTSRLNIAVTGAGSDVPELADENFGTLLISTQPIIVERSMYTDANGVTWAAGTNATATRIP